MVMGLETKSNESYAAMVLIDAFKNNKSYHDGFIKSIETALMEIPASYDMEKAAEFLANRILGLEDI